MRQSVDMTLWLKQEFADASLDKSRLALCLIHSKKDKLLEKRDVSNRYLITDCFDGIFLYGMLQSPIA